MYDGVNKEFVEFTNVGSTPIDMTGWSYDDNSRTAGLFSLSAFGIVQPGESRQIILNDQVTDIVTAGWPTGWCLINIKMADGTFAAYKLIVP